MIDLWPTTATMKHLGCLSAMEAQGDDRAAREATAIFLSLRLLDAWFAVGSVVISPDTLSLTETRKAIDMLDSSSATRALLFRLLGTVQTLARVDIAPIAPILYACAEGLIDCGRLELAADVFAAALDFTHSQADPEIYLDAANRLAWCRREMGLLAEADAIYITAIRIAEWHGDGRRAIRLRMGLANSVRIRGDLPSADLMFGRAIADARRINAREIESMGLIDQSILANQRGDAPRAVCLSFSAYDLTSSERQREKILVNTAAFLLSMGRLESARDAFLLQEAVAISDRMRTLARINLLTIAARTADRTEFNRLHALLVDVPMAADERVNYLIESARGLEIFGDLDAARTRLIQALGFAERLGLSRSIFEAERVLAALGTEKKTGNPEPIAISAEVARVELELRAKACALAA